MKHIERGARLKVGPCKQLGIDEKMVQTGPVSPTGLRVNSAWALLSRLFWKNAPRASVFGDGCV